MSLYGSIVRFVGIQWNFERTSPSGFSDEMTIV